MSIPGGRFVFNSILSFCLIQYTLQKAGSIVEEHRVLSADNTINWESILLVERVQTGSGGCAFTVHFVDEQSVTYHQDSPEGAVLYDHWERYAPKVAEDAERIPIR
jgi:hypothetical protein